MAKTSKKSFKNAPKPSGELAPELLAFAEGKNQPVMSPQKKLAAAKALEYMSIKSQVEAEHKEKSSRLSIDLPESMHRRYKAALAANGLKMRSELVEFIADRLEELEKPN